MKTFLTHPRTLFWVRMILWLAIGCAVPVIVFASKFGLFTTNVPEVDELGNAIGTPNVSLNGWGIISCLIVGGTLIHILQELAAVNTGYSLLKQCYIGFSKLIPFVIVLAACHFLSGAMSQVIYCLTIYVICRAISIPIDPLPKWRYDKLGTEDYSDALNFLTTFKA